jgi:predicted MFS family arabinose efflux permease
MENKVKYQNAIVVSLLLLIIGAAISMHQFKVPTIMDEVAQSVNISSTAAPWLMSLFTITGILFAVPVGGLVQKLKSKSMIILAALCIVIGSLVGAFAPHGSILLASRALEGLGFLFIAVAGPVAISRYCDPTKIGSAMGIWAVWVATGQIIAFNTTPIFMHVMDWRGLWMLFAGVTLAMAVISYFGLKEPTGVIEKAAQNDEPNSGQIKDVLKNKNLICASFAFTIFNLLLIAVLTFLPGYAVQSGLMTVQEASFAATIPMIGCLIGSPIMGRLSEAYGRKKLYLISLLASGLGTLLAFTATRPLIYIGVILFGLVGLGAPGLVMGSVAKIVGDPRQEGSGMGILITFQNLGMFLGTAVFIPILTLVGGSYTAAGVALLIISFIGAGCAAIAKMN